MNQVVGTFAQPTALIAPPIEANSPKNAPQTLKHDPVVNHVLPQNLTSCMISSHLFNWRIR